MKKKITKKNNIHKLNTSVNQKKKVSDTHYPSSSEKIVVIDKHNYCKICYDNGYNEGYKDAMRDFNVEKKHGTKKM